MPLSLFAFLLASAPAFAQVGGGSKTLVHLEGLASGDEYGHAVAAAGDVNNDGFPDYAVGAWMADSPGMPNAGAAYVYSGLDGTLLHQWSGQAEGDWFGYMIRSIGDINHDGFDDLVISAPLADPSGIRDAGTTYVFSGADGSRLFTWHGIDRFGRFGNALAGAGDVNGDGFLDVLVGAPFNDDAGVAYVGSAFVFSGLTGMVLYQWQGSEESEYFGFSVAGPGDINGDGRPDLLVGAPNASPAGRLRAGATTLFSGMDGSVLTVLEGDAPADNFGNTVSDIGDANGDGVPDLLIGAPGTQSGGIYYVGTAYVVSGADYSRLIQQDSEPDAYHFGSALSPAGDLDGDGNDDFLVGAYLASPNGISSAGSAFVYSGKDGRLIHRWDGEEAFTYTGVSVAGVGDLDADGLADVMVGTSFDSPGGLLKAGSANIYSWTPFITASSDHISDQAAALIALELQFPIEAAFMEYKVLLSANGTGPFHLGVDIPLTADDQFVNAYFGLYPFPLSANLTGTLDATGSAIASFGKLAGTPTGAVGRTIHIAAIANQPGQLPAYSSVAVPIEIVP